MTTHTHTITRKVRPNNPILVDETRLSNALVFKRILDDSVDLSTNNSCSMATFRDRAEVADGNGGLEHGQLHKWLAVDFWFMAAGARDDVNVCVVVVVRLVSGTSLILEVTYRKLLK